MNRCLVIFDKVLFHFPFFFPFGFGAESRSSSSVFLSAAREMNESQKMKEEGGGGEGRKRLQTNPSILKTCVRQRTQRLIGLESRTILTCVDLRFVLY